MTLEKIRAALPTHIMLTPGVHRWREGDEYWSKTEGEWVKATHMDTKILCEMGSLISFRAARRPIPPHILDNQAFWLWISQFNGVVPTWENVKKRFAEGRLYDKWLVKQMEDV
jgi:hypothetical protein